MAATPTRARRLGATKVGTCADKLCCLLQLLENRMAKLLDRFFSPRSEPAKSPGYQRFKGPLGDSGKTGIQLRNWKDSWRYLDWARLRYVRHAYILLLSIYVPRVTIHLVPAPRMNKCNCAQLPSSSEHQV